jgi:hypothetical protein
LTAAPREERQRCNEEGYLLRPAGAAPRGSGTNDRRHLLFRLEHE